MIYKVAENKGKTALGMPVQEAALPMNQSHSDLRGHLSKALADHHGTPSDSWSGPYVQDVFPQHVVYSHKGQSYKASYTAEQGAAGTNPVIKLGKNHKKVHVAYVDNANQGKESMSVILGIPVDMVEDTAAIEALRETKSVYYTLPEGEKLVTESVFFDVPTNIAKESEGKPSTVLIKIIGPGWGSSAFYSKGVLKESATKVYKKGTHMMWNHQTTTEESERPEGDLSNLAAVLTEDSYYMESGIKGPGLYAKAKVFSDYAQAVQEKGPHIGVSINAGIKCHEGEAEGRKGLIADAFVHAYSADFVTKPGAGGAPIVPARESLQAHNSTSEDNSMTEQEAKDLLESNKTLATQVTKLTESITLMQTKEAATNAENARLAVVRSAITAVTDALHEAGVTVKARLIEAACAAPTHKEGKVDVDWIKGVVADFTESFATAGGKVRNMGVQTFKDNDEGTTKEASDIMSQLGVPEKGLAIALKGGR